MPNENFPSASQNTPTTIGKIRYVFTDGDGSASSRSARFNLDVYDQNGELMQTMRGDLLKYLTTQETNQIVSFMNNKRAQAEAEILSGS